MTKPSDPMHPPTRAIDVPEVDAHVAASGGDAPAPKGRAAAGDRPASSLGRGVHPLGPLVRIARLKRPVAGRVVAFMVAAGAMTTMGIAAWLPPREAGFGTHEALGYPPCGFIRATGLPCPTCGMTTAFAYTARGRFVSAFMAQPAGLVLAILTGVAAVLGLTAALAGQRLEVNWYRLRPERLLLWGLLFYVLSWGLKIAIGLARGTLPKSR